MRSSTSTVQILTGLCLLSVALCASACSIPNLESASCSEARIAARQFYSFHFGNDMNPTVENLELRARFLTSENLKRSVDALRGGNAADPFTIASEKGLPRTFKIGQCEQVGDDTVDMQVQFYWRDDLSTDQKELHAKMVRRSGSWLVDSIGPIEPR